jgi:hypothetical protein
LKRPAEWQGVSVCGGGIISADDMFSDFWDAKMTRNSQVADSGLVGGDFRAKELLWKEQIWMLLIPGG